MNSSSDTMASDTQQKPACAPWGKGNSESVLSRRRRSGRSWGTIPKALTCLVSLASAATITSPPLSTETLCVDPRTPVLEDGQWTYVTALENVELRGQVYEKRAGNSTSKSNSTATSTTSSTQASNTAALDKLPTPFDSSLAGNWTTQTCKPFFESFLKDATFQSCYPFSMLVQSSRGFFNAQRSVVSTTQVLDATCSANASSCSTYLTQLSKNLTDINNCGGDYKEGVPAVVEAYVGMLSYQTMYSAACYKDPSTSAYCYANAITNRSNSDNVYVYWLPLNHTLPTDSTPSCNECLHQTMNIYQAASANRRLPIAYTYSEAAKRIETVCGSSFGVNVTLPIALAQNAVAARTPPWIPLVLSSLLAAWLAMIGLL